uniref:Methylmalonyl-CoA epimerase, mitochondrial isoform X1 n=1 Tax=Petromyzon marinus TaxID=7757 RepID=A0AAJ7UD02_PETMA|nr:methylmalonyl-CoA epimerase, mitochondrial isoform X1 [Petromyzon marinus]
MTSAIAMATLRTQLLRLRLPTAALGVPRRSAACRLGPLAAGGTAARRGLAQHTGLPGAVGERLWGLGRLNHVAVAVPNLEAATRLYRDVLGAQVSGVVPLPEHGVSTVFVDLGNTKIELLEPLGDKSPIAGDTPWRRHPPPHLALSHILILRPQGCLGTSCILRASRVFHICSHRLPDATVLLSLWPFGNVCILQVAGWVSPFHRCISEGVSDSAVILLREA